ncbi:hypothetical protein [Psychrobacter lutiphocae]|nr:hypothetical protein [Psychrobacter lutiphocae]
MGDDCDAPHDAKVSLKPNAIDSLILDVLEVYPLASVAVPMVHWTCHINDIKVATIEVNDKSEKFVNYEQVNNLILGLHNKIHFKYFS